MKAEVVINNVQKPTLSVKFDDTGNLMHKLGLDCVLLPGDMERVIQMFKERVKYGIPIVVTFSSPQAKMDLVFKTIGKEPVDKVSTSQKVDETPIVPAQDQAGEQETSKRVPESAVV